MTLVLGLDLSLTATGWATIADTGEKNWNVIRTDKKDGPIGWRLDRIISALEPLLPDTKLAVVEQPFNAKWSIDPAKVFGVVVYRLHRLCVPAAIVPPASLKVFATGAAKTGGNPKIHIANAARERLGYPGNDDNEIDALWLAALGRHLLGEPLITLPLAHTRALSSPWARPWPGHITPAPKSKKKAAA